MVRLPENYRMLVILVVFLPPDLPLGFVKWHLLVDILINEFVNVIIILDCQILWHFIDGILNGFLQGQLLVIEITHYIHHPIPCLRKLLH